MYVIEWPSATTKTSAAMLSFFLTKDEESRSEEQPYSWDSSPFHFTTELEDAERFVDSRDALTFIQLAVKDQTMYNSGLQLREVQTVKTVEKGELV